MAARPPIVVANRLLLAVFAVVLLAATIIAVHEIFFALPRCPGGADTCPARDAHWTGSRLVAVVLAVLWIVTALWGYAARATTRRARGSGWLIAFWLLPAIVATYLVAILR